MGIPRSLMWLVVTGAIVAGLVGLSYLALDKPNVVWSEGAPHCPHCRTVVALYARRCPACREEFDWAATSDDDGPRCSKCLAPSEDEWLRARRTKLGEETSVKRVAAALGLAPEAASSYLKSIALGDCAYCGGTGRDLAAKASSSTVCPVCFGEKRCIACDGDRHVRVGLEAAARELERYQGVAKDVTRETMPEAIRKALKAGDEAFLRRYAGTAEASDLYFWPDAQVGDDPLGTAIVVQALPAAGVARARLDRLIEAMRAD